MPYRYWRFVLYCVRTLYIQNWKTAVTRSCEIEKLVGTHIWKLCVLLRSRVLYAPLIGVTMRSRDHIGYDTVNIRLILFPIRSISPSPFFCSSFFSRASSRSGLTQQAFLPPPDYYVRFFSEILSRRDFVWFFLSSSASIELGLPIHATINTHTLSTVKN